MRARVRYASRSIEQSVFSDKTIKRERERERNNSATLCTETLALSGLSVACLIVNRTLSYDLWSFNASTAEATAVLSRGGGVRLLSTQHIHDLIA